MLAIEVRRLKARYGSAACVAIAVALQVPNAAASDEPFLLNETITIFGNVMWIAGERVTGPEVELRFDGQRFFVGHAELPLEIKRRVIPDSDLSRAYGNVHRVSELRATGLTISEAAEQFEQEFESLVHEAAKILVSVGPDSACAILQCSPLVESARYAEPSAYVEVQGIAGERVLMHFAQFATPRDKHAFKYSRADRVFELVNQMKQNLGREYRTPAVLFVGSRGGTLFATGADAARAEAQVKHLREGGSKRTMPKGPFVPSDYFLEDFVEGKAQK